MITLALANYKGGVGNTATAHALGVVLVTEHRRRALLVDADPQAALTGACAVRDAAGRSLAEVLGGASLGRLPLRFVTRDFGWDLASAPYSPPYSRW